MREWRSRSFGFGPQPHAVGTEGSSQPGRLHTGVNSGADVRTRKSVTAVANRAVRPGRPTLHQVPYASMHALHSAKHRSVSNFGYRSLTPGRPGPAQQGGRRADRPRRCLVPRPTRALAPERVMLVRVPHMPVLQRELIAKYGAAVTSGTAALFVGAGLSRSSGYPDWEQLLQGPRTLAEIPGSITDLPLVAEYFQRNIPGGREALDMHVLDELRKVNAQPGAGHRLLARLPIEDFWTTNYDCLIEGADDGLKVVYSEDDLRERRAGRRRLVKMHGSTDVTASAWRQKPILTRGDYERFEDRHPRTWAALRAAYLTRSFLFLGFSFADPNIELLLRLARGLGDLTAPEHFTVLRRPTDADKVREHELRVQDLENSGIAVCEIESYDDLVPLLGKLVRRTRQPFLFVSGSDSGDSNLSLARAVGNRLADLQELKVSSLAGPAALHTSFGFGDARFDRGRYRAQDIEFHFRAREDAEAPRLDQRTGTAIHTGLSQDELRRLVLDEARVSLMLGGGGRTDAEIDLALELGVPVIPMPTTGGAAGRAYERLTAEAALGTDSLSDDDATNWRLLRSTTPETVVGAVARLVRSAAYVGDSGGM